jgi:hypothetical protein
MRRLIVFCSLVLLLSGVAVKAARAQAGLSSQEGFQTLSSESSFQTAGTPTAEGNGTGVRLSEDSILHFGVGAEAGYDSNVFYDDRDRISSPILRVTPSVEITNTTRDGAVPSGAAYSIAGALQYREYLTDDPNAKAQRAFNPSVSAGVEFSQNRAISFGLSEQFSRMEEPPYGAGTGSITRDFNLAAAQLRLAPGGGRVQAVLRYSNSIDFFETENYKFANMMGHDVMLDASWRWFPKTALYLTISQGVINYFNQDSQPEDQKKQSSYPLRVMAGLRGLVTEKISVSLGAGYAAGFYQGAAENPSGLGNLAAVGEVIYSPTLLTRLLLGYRHEFRNSVIGTYYDLDAVYLGLEQNIASRFVLAGFGRLENRVYHGLRIAGVDVPRTDRFATAGAHADFYVQRWFYMGVGYSLTYNDSSLSVSTSTDPAVSAVIESTGLDYVKHQVFGRVGIVY